MCIHASATCAQRVAVLPCCSIHTHARARTLAVRQAGGRENRFTLQLCFWDLFKEFGSCNSRKATNLAQLLSHLVRNFVLSLSMVISCHVWGRNDLTAGWCSKHLAVPRLA